LCTEILEYTSKEEIAVCNLASVALPMFVTPEKTFDFNKLYDVSQTFKH
jgi:ribonucleoside-diphosphate reductase subunit M1